MSATPRKPSRRATPLAGGLVGALVGALVLGVSAAAAVGATLAASGCGDVDNDAITDVPGPSLADFVAKGGVNEFLEVRCASLDCHGQLGRPLRLYSGKGLRLQNDAGLVPGFTSFGTPDERVENYYSVIGLEPERLGRVLVSQGAEPDTFEDLLLITKPRNQVKHRGGAIIEQGDLEGDRCLTSWLTGQTDMAACKNAASLK